MRSQKFIVFGGTLNMKKTELREKNNKQFKKKKNKTELNWEGFYLKY